MVVQQKPRSQLHSRVDGGVTFVFHAMPIGFPLCDTQAAEQGIVALAAVSPFGCNPCSITSGARRVSGVIRDL